MCHSGIYCVEIAWSLNTQTQDTHTRVNTVKGKLWRHSHVLWFSVLSSLAKSAAVLSPFLSQLHGAFVQLSGPSTLGARALAGSQEQQLSRAAMLWLQLWGLFKCFSQDRGDAAVKKNQLLRGQKGFTTEAKIAH